MKKTILKSILELVFLVIFNLLFFTLGGTSHPASVWISYGFINFAYIMVILTPILSKTSVRDTVLGLSIYSVSIVYLLIECVIGIIFIAAKPEDFVASLLVQTVMACIYAAAIVSALMVNENTAEIIDRRNTETNFTKSGAARLKLLIGQLPDSKANKALECVYDLLHASPIQSTPTAYAIENAINSKIDELEQTVRQGDEENVIPLCNQLQILINERTVTVQRYY
jgi:hypothetical protein